VNAEAEPHDAQLSAEFLHQSEVCVELVAGLVNRAKRRAGELHLAARLERDGRALLLEGDGVLALEDALPVVGLGDSLEQGADAALPLEGHRAPIALVEADLLVLGADPPALGRLLPAPEKGDQVLYGLDRGVAVVRRTRVRAHGAPPRVP
jgi:hypothetical protein